MCCLQSLSPLVTQSDGGGGGGSLLLPADCLDALLRQSLHMQIRFKSTTAAAYFPVYGRRASGCRRRRRGGLNQMNCIHSTHTRTQTNEHTTHRCRLLLLCRFHSGVVGRLAPLGIRTKNYAACWRRKHVLAYKIHTHTHSPTHACVRNEDAAAGPCCCCCRHRRVSTVGPVQQVCTLGASSSSSSTQLRQNNEKVQTMCETAGGAERESG